MCKIYELAHIYYLEYAADADIPCLEDVRQNTLKINKKKTPQNLSPGPTASKPAYSNYKHPFERSRESG